MKIKTLFAKENREEDVRDEDNRVPCSGQRVPTPFPSPIIYSLKRKTIDNLSSCDKEYF